MRLLILTLSIVGSFCIFSISGCLDSTIAGLEGFRQQSRLGFEALLLCSFLQFASGMLGGFVTVHQLKKGQKGLLGIYLLVFSTLLSMATYSFLLGGFLCGAAALIAFIVKLRSKPPT